MEEPTKAKRRRKGPLSEVDTKTLKMSDLLSWKPTTKNNLREKWNAKRKELLEKAEVEESSTAASTSQASKPPPSTANAPRVKLNDKGEIVIDTESLLITEKPDDKLWINVDEVRCSFFQLNLFVLFISGYYTKKAQFDEL